ncbi:aromatic acid exporter family protein [Aquibacillus albus]|uniref:Uncharacterized membrane protein YgaE (UPF0421/DUF939 family) n=1 Tax=Aquibacillus albus TaxID=1168171 RepID=A0ABS2MWN7_9BACI|nr:uncharacterized membrane protein YgaE (UPF0421/DUF939 family) [Aquibacillus albus]
MKSFPIKFVGGRVVKTGIAVFLTSIICQWLNWPAVFAVITAIVTIEPTVSDSIKKGLVRFPATAIGSAYAVLFIFLFGNSPFTYTAAALCTIITCFKLNLRDGLLVATLTSVAMIEVIHSNYFIAFFIRLGTTSIGLLVSTLVNMFVLPPNYSKTIMSNIQSLLKMTGEELDTLTKEIFISEGKKKNHDRIRQTFSLLKKELDHTEMLLQFQKEESKYHRFDEEEQKVYNTEQDQLSKLRLIHYHIGNLIGTPLHTVSWEQDQCNKLIQAVSSLADTMKQPSHFRLNKHREQVHELMDQFWASKNVAETKQETTQNSNLFSAEIIILYELLSIYNLVESLLIDAKK